MGGGVVPALPARLRVHSEKGLGGERARALERESGGRGGAAARRRGGGGLAGVQTVHNESPS